MAHFGATSSKLPIVQYWHSEDVPAEVAALTATFRDHNPKLRHLVFNETEAEEFIAGHFTDREVSAFRACAVPAMQADYFRYCAILTLGGVYSDVSFHCLRPLRPLIETIDGGLLFRQQRPRQVVINGFFVFTAPGHPLLRLALDVATANVEQRAAAAVNLVTGPWIFSGLAEIYRLGSLDPSRLQAPNNTIKRLAGFMFEVIEDYARVSAAFERVRIESLSMAADWIGAPKAQLRYKQSDTRWIDWPRKRGEIFR
jgi:mannosyltransferase OCH1-like enzyme